MIGIFWLFSKLWHTKSICDNLFDLKRSSELPQKRWHHSHSNTKWLKLPESHFHGTFSHKSHHFPLFWCIFSTATPDISRSSENINKTVLFSDYLSVSYEYAWSLQVCFGFLVAFTMKILNYFINWLMKFLIYMFTLSRILTCIHMFYDCRYLGFSIWISKKK